MNRNFIGIEREPFYVEVANERLSKIAPLSCDLTDYKIERQIPKVPFGSLIEKGLIKIGSTLYSKDKKYSAVVLADGSLDRNGEVASIHKISANILSKPSNNGWKYWFLEKNHLNRK